MKCPHCGADNPDGSRYCSSCGKEIEDAGHHRRRLLPVGVALVGVAAIVALGLVFAGGPRTQPPWYDGVEINPRTIVYDEEASPFRIIASDDESVTVTTMDGIPDGSIIAAGVTDAIPDGLLRWVGEAEAVEGGWRIATTPAALSEAIDRCDIEATVTFMEDGSYEVSERAGGTGPFAIAQAYAREPPNTLTLALEAEVSKDMSASDVTLAIKDSNGHEISLEVEEDEEDEEPGREVGAFVPVRGEVKVGFSVDVSLRIDHGSVEMGLTAHPYLHKGIEVGPATVTLDGEKEFKSLFDRAFTVLVGPVPVVFATSVQPVFALSAEVSAGDDLNYGATLDKAYGFTYTTAHGLEPMTEDESEGPTFEFEAKDGLDASIAADAGLDFECMLYGFAGPSVETGVHVEGEGAGLHLVSGDAYAPCVLDVGQAFSGDLSLKATVPISGHFKLEVPNFNPFDTSKNVLADYVLFNRDLVTLCDWHESYMPPSELVLGTFRYMEGPSAMYYLTVSDDGTATGSLSWIMDGMRVAEEDDSYTWRVMPAQDDGTRDVLFTITNSPSGSGNFEVRGVLNNGVRELYVTSGDGWERGAKFVSVDDEPTKE